MSRIRRRVRGSIAESMGRYASSFAYLSAKRIVGLLDFSAVEGLPVTPEPMAAGEGEREILWGQFVRELPGVSPMINESVLPPPFESVIACRPPGISRSLIGSAESGSRTEISFLYGASEARHT